MNLKLILNKYLLGFSTTRAAMDESFFSKLPPEIRNTIYNLAIPETQYQIRYNSSIKKFIVWQQHSSDKIGEGLALASTCRQAHQESSALFYSKNAFSFITVGAFKAITEVIGDENSKGLRNIVIHKFAITRFASEISKSFRGNNLAREELYTLLSLAKRFGLHSVQINADFVFDGLLALAHIDIMRPNQGWRDIQGQPFSLESRYGNTGYAEDTIRKFINAVEAELKEWARTLEEAKLGEI